MAENDSCSVQGCERSRHRKSYCYAHYFRWYRNGDPGVAAIGVKNPGARCKEAECEKPAASRGLCQMHRTRLLRHGDPNIVRKPEPRRGETNWRWTGSEATYNAVHARLRVQRGAATMHECSCGQPAAQWSYDHTDPQGQVSSEGPYSTDLDRYEARCVPCHKRADLSRLNLLQLEGGA